REPKEVGQSGTERPASLLVTKAPAMMSMNVAAAVNRAKRCSARLYGVETDFRRGSLGSIEDKDCLKYLIARTCLKTVLSEIAVFATRSFYQSFYCLKP